MIDKEPSPRFGEGSMAEAILMIFLVTMAPVTLIFWRTLRPQANTSYLTFFTSPIAIVGLGWQSPALRTFQLFPGVPLFCGRTYRFTRRTTNGTWC